MKRLKTILMLGCVFSAYAMPYLMLGAGHFRRGTKIVRRSKAVFAGQEIDVDEVVA